MSIVCRLCGKGAIGNGAYLTRVNEKGVPGIWECRPVCNADLPQETLVLMAIEGVGDFDPMPNPTADDLADPLFNAIWEATRTWDVNAPLYYKGYCGMNGSHVMLILNSIRATQTAQGSAK